MKKFYILLIALFTMNGIVAQTSQPCSTCLPEGITFTSQNQIDNFQVNYPGCTEIEGSVTISGSDITNLNGLSVLTSIGGDLWIKNNSSLTSLPGLSGLQKVQVLSIDFNPALKNLEGLLSIDSIEYVSIGHNDVLTSLAGLENLTSIRLLYLIQNPSLYSLTGLGNLKSVEVLLLINNVLTSLAGLNSLEHIGGLQIEDEHHLTSLQGLENMTSIGGLDIYSNDALTSLTGLNNVTSINGQLLINACGGLQNMAGLESLTYLGGNLGLSNCGLISLNGLGNLNSIGGNFSICGNNSIQNLSGMDKLNSIGGDVLISGNSALENLIGLEGLICIGRNLTIGSYWEGNSALTSLAGLDNLTSIGGNMDITDNQALTSLDGLSSLVYIGGSLNIGSVNIFRGFGNHSLTSLMGLKSLVIIGGGLFIIDNTSLISLAGLENINSGSIDSLFIFSNSSLTTCEVKSICDYLSRPADTIVINNNATGCNSQEQVDSACVYLSNDEISSDPAFSIYPNPSSTTITIETPTTPDKNTFLTIYNLNGQQLISRQITEQQTVVDVPNLSQGIYFVRVADDRTVMVGKFVKN